MNKVAIIELYGVRFVIYRDGYGYWTPRLMAYYDSLSDIYDAIEHAMCASFII